MRLAIYSSNRGTTMRKAIEYGSEEFQNDIKLFFSDDPKTEYLKDFLESKGIQYILSPLHLADQPDKEVVRKKYWDQFLHILLKNQIDYIFCNGSHLFSGDILERYKNRIITFHGALLPAYPGVKMLDKMIEKREFLVGTSAIFVDADVDTGPIIMESVIPARAVFDDASCGINYEVAMETQIPMIHKVHKLLKEDRIKVEGKRVNIQEADYSFFSIFPKV